LQLSLSISNVMTHTDSDTASVKHYLEVYLSTHSITISIANTNTNSI